nr:hypothetical protein [Oscillospiraceae bacterium]
MNLFYAVLAYGMGVFNLIRCVNGSNVMNLVMAALWLIIGIVFTVKHGKEIKKAKWKKQQREKTSDPGQT